MRLPARLAFVSTLLAAAAATAVAQPSDLAQQNAQRAIEAASRVQERASRAQETSAAAQERAGRVLDLPARAAEAASAGLRMASRDNVPAFASAQFARFRDLVRSHEQVLELVDRFPAVRGEIVAIDPAPGALDTARKHGLAIVNDETVEGIDTRYVTFRVPAGESLQKAVAELQRIAPETRFTANYIHVQSGSSSSARAKARLAISSEVTAPAIGIIDGGVAESVLLPKLNQRGFAAGAPLPNAHGTAVASLAAGTGRIKSGSPGAPLLIADVYGNDPKGGNSLALARALGWMAERKVPVVVVSLVGPANPIVASAIEKVQAQGMLVVAPVGNGGPAAPPMYPAAYPNVVGVTGVDSRNRALVEAGRGDHVDFAAPGANILAVGRNGALVRVRGTSFAAPLVAGRAWRASGAGRVAALVRESEDLGRSGPDPVFGRGLVCGSCR
ncbi:S8 family serine peptidase [Altericroceibacterium xinjiangense]|uniref:S8 family serine peptidase n=1 Tax=Altericroceibacterium xinjiangense TaxID=762261 RepID=UPI000F7F9140|nr:S8 family serine peptidase [Altericroceibacterium xinjiangense]